MLRFLIFIVNLKVKMFFESVTSSSEANVIFSIFDLHPNCEFIGENEFGERYFSS